MNVYEVLIIQAPTRNEADEGHEDTIIFGPEKVQAATRELALLIVGGQLAAKKVTLNSRCTAHIRPF